MGLILIAGIRSYKQCRVCSKLSDGFYPQQSLWSSGKFLLGRLKTADTVEKL